ncbi:MAG: glycosyltransferase [Candidatus Cloacimonetes bacterium]|nr:glycosyltransferase [Candidatus Cloacimonadota bacterium]
MYDIVIGIPSYNEEDSISYVVENIDKGLLHSYPNNSAIIVNADDSDTDQTKKAFISTSTINKKKYIRRYHSIRGKGKGIFDIFKFSQNVGAKYIALFDADLISIEPDWVKKMLDPIINYDFDIVTPIYTRNRYEGNTTNHVVYPFLYAVYGAYIRQPIAGEFALSRRLVDFIMAQPSWDSTQEYGIDIFLTANAVANDYKFTQVHLTRKIHKPGFPKIHYMPTQVMDTMFRIFLSNPKKHNQSLTNDIKPILSVDDKMSYPSKERIEYVKGYCKRYIIGNQTEIQHDFLTTSNESFNVFKSRLLLGPEEWCHLLSHTYKTMSWERIDRISKSLGVLYLCRVFSYWDEIDGKTPLEIEKILFNQAILLRKLIQS